MRNATIPSAVGHNDYAANAGTTYSTIWWGSYGGSGEEGPATPDVIENPPGQMTTTGRAAFTWAAQVATGVIYSGSMIRMSDITDGTSSTYLAGEKYVDPDCYATGQDKGDSGDAFQGDNEDNSRYGNLDSPPPYYPPPMPPRPDTPGFEINNEGPFGSAHSDGFTMALCDGSVQFVNFSIDLKTHECLCNRMDGTAIDAKKIP
jgi:hypothetical protein